MDLQFRERLVVDFAAARTGADIVKFIALPEALSKPQGTGSRDPHDVASHDQHDTAAADFEFSPEANALAGRFPSLPTELFRRSLNWKISFSRMVQRRVPHRLGFPR
jgi:hypothetical protein